MGCPLFEFERILTELPIGPNKKVIILKHNQIIFRRSHHSYSCYENLQVSAKRSQCIVWQLEKLITTKANIELKQIKRFVSSLFSLLQLDLKIYQEYLKCFFTYFKNFERLIVDRIFCWNLFNFFFLFMLTSLTIIP